MPLLTDAQLGAIVERHGLMPDGPIAPMVSSGVVHSLWSLGSRWVLRVPKDETMCLGDHRCEAVAIPIALRAGVRTPELVVFDDSRSILDVPFSIVERVDGLDLSTEPFDHYAYQDAGRQLALLHSADLGPHRHAWLREPDDLSFDDEAAEVLDAGLLHVEGLAWLRCLDEHLHGVVAGGPVAPESFVHGDLTPPNVMFDRSGRSHLIDWGDAGFGDAAHDFALLPMTSIKQMLLGYRSVRTDDPTLEARIVRRVVTRSLSNLRRTPLAGPSWYRPVAANLADLMMFAIDRPETWARWTDAAADPAGPHP